MDFVVYILFSENYKKHYTGMTTDLCNRYWSHNKFVTKGYTLKYRPWNVIYVEFYSDKSTALKREKWLKSGRGRDFIKQLPLEIS